MIKPLCKSSLSVSNTTRKPRKGEIDGVHYNFVTKEQFEKLIGRVNENLGRVNIRRSA